MSPSTPHLVKRGQAFYFRRAVPEGLTKLVGSREVKASLRTSDPVTGKIRARVLSTALDISFRVLREVRMMTNEAILERARDYFSTALSKSLEYALLLPSDPVWDRHSEISYLKDHEAELRERLATQNFTPSVQSDALELLGIPQPAGNFKASESFQYACNAVARAKIENARILAAQFSGEYDKTLPLDPWFKGIVATGLPPLPGEQPSPSEKTFAAIAEIFFAFKSKTDWAPKTAADLKRVIALASNIIGGDRPIASIDIEDVKSIRDALSSLPPNFMKVAANNGISVQGAIAANISGAALSTKTQDKYFKMFRQLLIWACNEGYINKIPGAGIKVAGANKLVPGELRDPYSLDQLKKIFNSPFCTGHKSPVVRHKPGNLIVRDGKFWGPLIALYSGMRMGEIIQLLASDIKCENHVWFFDVSKGEGKSLKTVSSKRRVPIHRILIDLGLLDYLGNFSGNERVFPDIEKGKDGYHSHNFSKWWGRYARHIKVATPKTAFHSFRHNFVEALRACESPEYVNKALLGHTDKAVHGNYGGALKIEQLKKTVDLVSYQIDLAHLAAPTGEA